MSTLADLTAGRRRPAVVVLVAVLAVALVSLGCDSSSSSSTSPNDVTSLRMMGADVMIDGQSVGGMTIPPGFQNGNSTLFQAQLSGPQATAAGTTVEMEYRRPGGMRHGHGTLTLYDDGTHGDPFAHDGFYCFEDFDGHYGVHGHHAEHGEYHYEFYGVGPHGDHTGHWEVMVTIADNE